MCMQFHVSKVCFFACKKLQCIGKVKKYIMYFLSG